MEVIDQVVTQEEDALRTLKTAVGDDGNNAGAIMNETALKQDNDEDDTYDMPATSRGDEELLEGATIGDMDQQYSSSDEEVRLLFDIALVVMCLDLGR